MDKEEIKNKKRMLRDFSEEGQGQRVFFEEDLKLIRDMLKELEQKEFILDKVTDKLKEDIGKYNKELLKDSIMSIKNTDLTARILQSQKILNIIEGGNIKND